MVRSLPSQEFLCLCFSASPATFFYKGNSDAEHRSIPRKLKNLLFLILISELTYFSFYTLLHMRHVGFGIQAVINTIEAEVLNYYCKELTARLIVFAPPFNGIGWFISSLVVVYLVIWPMIRKERFRQFLLAFVVLMLLWLPVSRVLALLGLEGWLLYERILPLLPLPFFAIGYMMHVHQSFFNGKSDRSCLIVLAAGLLLTLAENTLHKPTLYVGTVLMVPATLLLCTKHSGYAPRSVFGRVMSHIGEKTATYIYLFHILIETVMRVAIDAVFPGIREGNLFLAIYPFLVFAASAVFGEIIYRLKLLKKHLSPKS